MKKTVTKTQNVEEEKYFCDCCGEEFEWSYCSRNMNKCWVCKNMICSNCRKVSAIDNDEDLWHDAYGTNRYICRDCEKVVKPYLGELNKLWETYLEQKRNIQKEMRMLREKEKNEIKTSKNR